MPRSPGTLISMISGSSQCGALVATQLHVGHQSTSPSAAANLSRST